MVKKTQAGVPVHAINFLLNSIYFGILKFWP